MNELASRIRSCACNTCRAVVALIDEAGALLRFDQKRAGRLCEYAIVAAAGENGVPEKDVVARRRSYAAHLGIILSGPTQNADTPIHILWAVNNPKRYPREQVRLGNATPSLSGGRFFLTWPSSPVGKRMIASQIVDEVSTGLSLLPEEVARPDLFYEGTTVRVSVNAYERNRAAVLQCKAIHGTACKICGFDFGAVYGPEVAGLIHVHHLTPLSEIGCEYVVNPALDLTPVCPNCHAVIHHGGRTRKIGEVEQMLLNRNL